MNILILGGGGREHALGWAVKQNPKCDRLFAAPGNPGLARIAACAALDILDGDAVAAFCGENAVDLVIVGPEAPLAAGVADRLRAVGLLVLGPSAAAARLESSKTFAKEIARAAGVPTARAWAFADPGAAAAHLRAAPGPIVVKADGLMGGKGVTVAATPEQALAALAALSGPVLLEEVLTGEEASLFVLCDGEEVLPIGTAQDHKRAQDGDRGPNTGGMGAYSPAPVLSHAVEARAMAEIVRPTLAEMARRGTPFRGVLYAGLMVREDGAPFLIEWNVRLGDPEAQVLMMRLGGQALDLLQAAAEGRLGEVAVNWADDHALGVVLAARGYPEAPERGAEIRGLDALPATSREMVFHAGTQEEGGRLIAAGGRVLTVAGRGETLEEARERAYALADRIEAPGLWCRRDIGWRALRRGAG
jgi:phosphoribosylamine--glycine ligase